MIIVHSYGDKKGILTLLKRRGNRARRLAELAGLVGLAGLVEFRC